jgi:hypothetical protein
MLVKVRVSTRCEFGLGTATMAAIAVGLCIDNVAA